jgi:hypothetical protein
MYMKLLASLTKSIRAGLAAELKDLEQGWQPAIDRDVLV